MNFYKNYPKIVGALGSLYWPDRLDWIEEYEVRLFFESKEKPEPDLNSPVVAVLCYLYKQSEVANFVVDTKCKYSDFLNALLRSFLSYNPKGLLQYKTPNYWVTNVMEKVKIRKPETEHEQAILELELIDLKNLVDELNGVV